VLASLQSGRFTRLVAMLGVRIAETEPERRGKDPYSSTADMSGQDRGNGV